MVVDEELEQDPACRSNTLAIMTQNGKQVFVFSHGIRLPEVVYLMGHRPPLCYTKSPLNATNN